MWVAISGCPLSFNENVCRSPAVCVSFVSVRLVSQVALGDCVAGAYTNNAGLWKLLHAAGSETGDRCWRMPLFKHYANVMTRHASYDVNNMNSGASGGGSCTAAAFLHQFVPAGLPWAHLDVSNLRHGTDQAYTSFGKGMAGRPMRTVVEFVEQVQRSGF